MTDGSAERVTRKAAMRADALARRGTLEPEYRIEAALQVAEIGEMLDLGPSSVIAG